MTWSELHVDGWDTTEGFCLRTKDGVKIGAKAVVSAVGPAGKPSIPAALKGHDQARCQSLSPLHGPGWCHSAALAHQNVPFPPPSVITKPSGASKTLVVVGGGLTSAQICDVALRRGFSKVKLLLRGHMKVKPFDIGLDWMGRYSNLRKMQFWQELDPSALDWASVLAMGWERCNEAELFQEAAYAEEGEEAAQARVGRVSEPLKDQERLSRAGAQIVPGETEGLSSQACHRGRCSLGSGRAYH